MATSDYIWNGAPISRLDAVKHAFRLMVEGGTGPGGEKLEGRPDDLIELVVYAARPETACPFTLEHKVLLKILDAQEPRTLTTEATTNTGDAIAWAVESLQRSPVKRKVLVLLSDGEHNVPPPALKPRQAAQLAGNLGIPIYAIHAGNETEDGKPSDEAARARQSLEDIARISRGQYFQAADSRALLQACRDIDDMERTVIPSYHYRLYYEGFAWFALASLAGWLALHLLESTIWRRVP
jgi:Ca-activated chloride channel family protein